MDRNDAIGYMGHVSWRVSRLGLHRIAALLALLGSPEENLHFIHVAGTNGKGSVCTFLASSLTAAGYKTGCFTSPFVNTFNERMQVNKEPISDEELATLTEEVRRQADTMEDHPTEFEMVTALGFLFFYRKKCDYVVLEVGLGGRLDATNVIPPPVLAVITSIGFDHMAELGNTLTAIATEKAGIIKPGCKVVLAPQLPEAEKAVEAVCSQLQTELEKTHMARLKPLGSGLDGQTFTWDGKELEIALAGGYQLANAATALTALEVLARRGLNLPWQAVQAGFHKARWPARMELLGQKPVVLLDGGHNRQGAQALARSLSGFFPGRRWQFVVGVMADKEWQEMLAEVLPLAGQFFCVAPPLPRALAPEQMAAGIASLGGEAKAFLSVRAGVEAAVEAAGEEGLVCAFGSLYMAGEIRAYFGKGDHHPEDFFTH